MQKNINQVPDHGHTNNRNYPEDPSATAQRRCFDDLHEREHIKNKAKCCTSNKKTYMKGAFDAGYKSANNKQYKRNDQ